jgi:hypothetical protein
VRGLPLRQCCRRASMDAAPATLPPATPLPSTYLNLSFCPASAAPLRPRMQVRLMDEKGYVIGNLDCTIIAQRPKLSPHKENIRQNLSHLLNADPSVINIKVRGERGAHAASMGDPRTGLNELARWSRACRARQASMLAHAAYPGIWQARWESSCAAGCP